MAFRKGRQRYATQLASQNEAAVKKKKKKFINT